MNSIASNFAGATSSTAYFEGQGWWDTVNKTKSVWNGSSWVPISAGNPHSGLSGLDQDDHPQYWRKNGSQPLPGLTMNEGALTDGLNLKEGQNQLAGTGNLLCNGSFDRYDYDTKFFLGGWELIGDPVIQNDFSATGDFGDSLRITPVSADEGIGQEVGVRPSTTYTLSFWVKAQATNEARVVVKSGTCYNLLTREFAGTVIVDEAYADLNWAFKKIVFTTGISTDYISVELLTQTSPAPVWYDHVVLAAGTNVAPYGCNECSYSEKLRAYGTLEANVIPLDPPELLLSQISTTVSYVRPHCPIVEKGQGSITVDIPGTFSFAIPVTFSELTQVMYADANVWRKQSADGYDLASQYKFDTEIEDTSYGDMVIRFTERSEQNFIGTVRFFWQMEGLAVGYKNICP